MTADGPELLIFPDVAALFDAAARTITAALASLLQRQESVSLVLTGGKTPGPVYGRLADRPLRDQIDWPRVHFFWGDERCVGPQDAESNFRMAAEALLSRVPVQERHVHRIPAELPEADDAARRYEAEILAVFPGAVVPSFDLVLLGMGTDGHTASLFPGATWDERRLVVPVYAPALKSQRISMTPLLLNAARQVLFIVAGRAKAQALRSVVPGADRDLPAARIRPASGRLTWMVDQKAADLLRKPE